MTDPIQTSNPQQQGQQWTVDDVLAWEDIFALIPEAGDTQQETEEKISYGDMLEKKFQFPPIQKTGRPMQEVNTPIEEIPTVVEPVAPVSTPIVSEKSIDKKEEIPVQVPAATSIPIQQAKEAPVQQIEKIEEVVEPQEDIVQLSEEQEEEQEEEIEEEIEEVQPEIQEMPKESVSQQAKVENLVDTRFQTDVQKKFGELFSTTKKIYKLKDKIWIADETFDILWANNDKIFISYRFLLDETNDPILFITKIEQDKETQEETVNELKFTFNEESSSLEVMINDTLLFDEVADFTQDQKKKLQVVDKINKFSFLASEEVRKIEKEIKEKEEMERERRKLQEIFRNF